MNIMKLMRWGSEVNTVRVCMQSENRSGGCYNIEVVILIEAKAVAVE